jgi:hypothetical protein
MATAISDGRSGLKIGSTVLHTDHQRGAAVMNDFHCMIQGCQANVYSPAGTQHVCKEHFFSFLTWRRRKGAQMFSHYAGLTMEQRDPIAGEWSKTVSIIEAPTAPQKP